MVHPSMGRVFKPMLLGEKEPDNTAHAHHHFIDAYKITAVSGVGGGWVGKMEQWRGRGERNLGLID